MVYLNDSSAEVCRILAGANSVITNRTKIRGRRRRDLRTGANDVSLSASRVEHGAAAINHLSCEILLLMQRDVYV